MNYPLHLSFKILALARQLRLTDASGNRIFHVKQKVFKLKEAVTVFVDRGTNATALFYAGGSCPGFFGELPFHGQGRRSFRFGPEKGSEISLESPVRHP